MYSTFRYPRKTGVKVRVPADSILNIDASEGCSIQSQKTIQGLYAALSLSSNSKAWLFFDVKQLDVDLNSGCMANLIGSAEKANLDIKSGATFFSDVLQIKKASVKGSDGSIIDINATDELDVDINSGCVVRYFGHPQLKGIKVESGARLIDKN